jgi:hypothetical protein
LRVDFVSEVERDLHGNQERGTPKHDGRDAGEALHDRRRDGNKAEEARAWKSYAIYHVTNVFFRLAAWTHSWDKGTGLLEIFSDALWLKRN